MKKGFIILLLLLPAIPLWFAACKPGKDNPEPKPELPPITQEGKNTFGCTINGELFTAPFSSNKAKCYYYYRISDGDLYGTIVINNQTNDVSKSVGIRLDTVVYDTGKYDLGTDAIFGKIARVALQKDKYEVYYCLEDTYGWLHIHFIDTVKHIASGTFEFDAVNEKDNKDTIKIRQGRLMQNITIKN